MENNLFKNYPILKPLEKVLNQSVALMKKCYLANGKILIAGNGGSSADASHMAGELLKSFKLKRLIKDKRINKEDAKYLESGIPAIDLTAQSGILSAFINDCSSDYMYAQLVYAYASKSKNDLLVVFSTSGNSTNIVKALKIANALGIKSIAITGNKESACSKLASIVIKTPAHETYRVQEYTLPIYHYLCAELEKELFQK